MIDPSPPTSTMAKPMISWCMPKASGKTWPVCCANMAPAEPVKRPDHIKLSTMIRAVGIPSEAVTISFSRTAAMARPTRDCIRFRVSLISTMVITRKQ